MKGRPTPSVQWGIFFCFDAISGQIHWQHDLQTEYEIPMPIWGIAGSPLIYKNLLIQQVGGKGGACMVAFDKATGKEVWRSLQDRAGHPSPIIIQQQGEDVLVCWTGDSLSGLDPKTGKVHWGRPFPPSRMPIGIGTPIIEGELLYVFSFYDGSLMVRLPKTNSRWKKYGEVGVDEQHTVSLHSMIGTCILEKGKIYGADSYGEFRCLDALTGKRIWKISLPSPKPDGQPFIWLPKGIEFGCSMSEVSF